MKIKQQLPFFLPIGTQFYSTKCWCGYEKTGVPLGQSLLKTICWFLSKLQSPMPFIPIISCIGICLTYTLAYVHDVIYLRLFIAVWFIAVRV